MSGDYQLEDTIFLPFTTRQFSDGVPTALAGTPAIDIYEDATASPIVTGETLAVSLNSVVGFNMITVVATAGDGFNAGGFYTAIIQAGTVGGVSVVGEVVATFSIETVAKAVWDRALTGSTHNIATSAGKRLRQIDAAFEVHSGTARITSTSTTIDLETATADNTTDEIYAGDRCVIVGGTGIGEHGLILSYNSTTQVATMSKAWVITPDQTSEYILSPADVDVELWNDNTVTGDGDWSTVASEVTAIKVPTDKMAFTKANELDSNILSVVGDTVQTSSSKTTNWGGTP